MIRFYVTIICPEHLCHFGMRGGDEVSDMNTNTINVDAYTEQANALLGTSMLDAVAQRSQQQNRMFALSGPTVSALGKMMYVPGIEQISIGAFIEGGNTTIFNENIVTFYDREKDNIDRSMIHLREQKMSMYGRYRSPQDIDREMDFAYGKEMDKLDVKTNWPATLDMMRSSPKSVVPVNNLGLMTVGFTGESFEDYSPEIYVEISRFVVTHGKVINKKPMRYSLNKNVLGVEKYEEAKKYYHLILPYHIRLWHSAMFLLTQLMTVVHKYDGINQVMHHIGKFNTMPDEISKIPVSVVSPKLRLAYATANDLYAEPVTTSYENFIAEGNTLKPYLRVFADVGGMIKKRPAQELSWDQNTMSPVMNCMPWFILPTTVTQTSIDFDCGISYRSQENTA